MSPVTTRRRGPQRGDARRRHSGGHGSAQLPTLFDPAPGGPAAQVDAGERPSAAARVDEGERPSEVAVAAGSGETLDRLVVSSWERLAGHAVTPCLVCGGTMEPAYGAHAVPVGGRCRDCATTLG